MSPFVWRELKAEEASSVQTSSLKIRSRRLCEGRIYIGYIDYINCVHLFAKFVVGVSLRPSDPIGLWHSHLNSDPPSEYW